ncbi:MAG: hypothetical protein ACRC7B_02225, partial [Metamycoplasmataceae bacterium]
MSKTWKKMALGVMTTGALVVPLAVVASCGSSTASEVADFNIETKNNPKVRFVDVSGNKYKEYKTLAKVFDGIDPSILGNVDASLKYDMVETEYSESLKNEIILTAKSGYSIKGKKSITSEEFDVLPNFFEITALEILDNIEITSSDLSNINDINFLQKLFTGIEYDDMDDMDVVINDVLSKNSLQKYTITLKAKGEFYFNNNKEIKSLTSNEFSVIDVDLQIAVKNNPEILKVDIENDKYKSLETLQKLFDGLTNQNLNAIETIVINNKNIEFGEEYWITLLAKDGYNINGKNALVSKEFILPTVLKIEQLTSIPENITHLDLKDDLYKEFNFLSKIFLGLKAADLEHLDIELTNTTNTTPFIIVDGSYTVTLKIKDKSNFVFLDGDLEVKQITSKKFTLIPFNYVISIKEKPQISVMDVEGDKYKTLSTLQKLFNGITQEILNNLQVEFMGEIGSGTNHKIVLIADKGYTINGDRSITSDDFNLESILNVTPKLEAITLSFNEVNGGKYKDIATIKKLFNLEDADFSNFTINISNESWASASTHTITLTANDDFAFANWARTITKEFTMETILDVTSN